MSEFAFRAQAHAWFTGKAHRESALEITSGEKRWTVIHGGALEVLRALPSASVDSMVTDPPAGIGFMSRAWDKDKGGRDKWIAWLAEILAEAFRVLKPGAHGLVWSLPRTSHWTGLALEQAGFEIRDTIHHAFGSGFPKSVNVGKEIDRLAGAEREVVGSKAGLPGYSLAPNNGANVYGVGIGGTGSPERECEVTAPATDEAKIWDGYGTGLKPAHELWWLVRKPLDGTIVGNVLKYGTGAINIDGCRVAHASPEDLADHIAQVEAIKARGGSMEDSWKNASDLSGANDVTAAGRFPANFVLTHSADCVRMGESAVTANPSWDTPNRDTEPSSFTSEKVSKVRHGNPTSLTETIPRFACVVDCPVRLLDEQSGDLGKSSGTKRDSTNHVYGAGIARLGSYQDGAQIGKGDSGTASRFFAQFELDLNLDHPFYYGPKPSRGERDAGLEAFRVQQPDELTGRKEGSAGCEHGRAGKHGASRNVHPTVKSVAQMRYFTRLVTPRGGVCIDPFTGSGTTGVGAVMEGFRFIGIELNDSEKEPFASIARARIRHVIGGDYRIATVQPVPANDAVVGLKQMSLFG